MYMRKARSKERLRTSGRVSFLLTVVTPVVVADAAMTNNGATRARLSTGTNSPPTGANLDCSVERSVVSVLPPSNGLSLTSG